MKTQFIGNLRVGDIVQVPSLKDTMRNLKITRISDCSTSVSGQMKEGFDAPWRSFSHNISNATEVIIDTNPMLKNEIISNELIEIGGVKVEKTPKIKKVGGKRGRKKQEINLTIPKTNFTIKNIAESHRITPSLAYLRVMEEVKLGNVKIKTQGKRGRGGSPTIYIKNK